MKACTAIRGCVFALVLQLAAQLALAADPPRTIKKSDPAAPHSAKPSSFAPRAHSKNHVYGAPIQQPIFHSRNPARKAVKPATPDTSAAQSGK